MFQERLGDLLLVDQLMPAFEAAMCNRDLAGLAHKSRIAAGSKLGDQMARGIWRSLELEAAIASATSDRLLLSTSWTKYVEAHGGACDLENEYHPLLPAGQALSLDDIAIALAFVASARPSDPLELWFGALQDEATAYLHQLRGDHYLAQAIQQADAIDAQLVSLIDPTDPSAARNIIVHSAAVALFRELDLPWRVEAAYRRFLVSVRGDAIEVWQSREAADPNYSAATADAFLSLVVNVLPALELHNPSDRTEIERLEGLLQQYFAPSLVPYEPDVVALPDLPPSVFAAAAGALHRIVAALTPARSRKGPRRSARPASVLAAWEAFARRGLRDFRQLARRLQHVKPDDEALGIVVCALRGEAYYRMCRYEDAYLDLLTAEDAARAALDRRAGGVDKGDAGWNAAERDGLARLAQKAGNALAAIGDEERAGEAYKRAGELATGPLAAAGSFLNDGNRHFLHNSVVGGQGYITLDAEARQEFVLHGPEKLIASVIGQHVSSLCNAESSYQAALAVLRGIEPGTPGAQMLAATCHIDLGNVGWAWGQTLFAEGASALANVLPDAAFASQLVVTESDAIGCYRAAVAEYEAALNLLDAGQAGAQDAAPVSAEALSLVITALSSLSEMRYLIARQILRAEAGLAPDALQPLQLGQPEPGSPAFVSLSQGIDEAGRCLGLIDKDDRALYPDLVWRTQYNLARMYRLLGKLAEAAEHFSKAIETVESLRAELRVDSLQSVFLHDKHDVYEGNIDLLLEQGLLAQDSVANVPRIFALFEQSRARAFLSLLQAAQVKTRLPKPLRTDADALLAKISACNEAIQAAVAADSRVDTETLLAEQKVLARRWADMQSKIARSQQRADRKPLPIPRLADFQAALAEDQGYLGLLFGDEASYALLIDRSAARVFRLPPRRTLELLALPVLTYATWSNAETACEFRCANVKLTEALLGPIDAEIGLKSWLNGKHLLISPDGILCYLPFETLLADTAGVAALPDTADYPDLASFYLLSLADVSYIPSAGAWLEIGQHKREPSRAGLMAVYNVLYDSAEPPQWAVAENIMLKLGAVTSAPDMKRITDALVKAWGQDTAIVRLRSRTDDGSPETDANQSTERNFLRVAPDARARMLLFHGHGIYNDRYPSLSGLVFNLTRPPDQGKRAAIPTAEDGFLRVEELFQLEMPGVEMTMLAACQTALGAYRRGEGLSALVRAFLYQGSPAVTATLWEVRADMTAFILRVFFNLLAQQPDADRARLFSQARRKAMPYVANLYLPYFWAPFVLWGYTAPQPL